MTHDDWPPGYFEKLRRNASMIERPTQPPLTTSQLVTIPGFDAREWVKLWRETIAKHPEIPTDDETMLGWFANAIMRGYDEAAQKSEKLTALLRRARVFVPAYNHALRNDIDEAVGK